MTAQFILSLDCEGKWGVADRLTAKHRRDLCDDRLREAYQSIVGVLDEYEIPATFAFVGAFAQSPEAFARIRPDIEALQPHAPAYLSPALRDIDESGGAGWHGHQLLDAVANARSQHEIALHGVTHVPWNSVDATFARDELRICDKLEGPVRDSRTFVYPRNHVAHIDVLAKHGLAGFRAAGRERSRAMSLLSEFNLFEAPEEPQRPRGIVAIPAGFFLNWRSGLRRMVPPSVTRMRAMRLLDSATETGAVVHYWLHPENVASAPPTLELVGMLAREVATRRDSGTCEVLTQLAYCRRVESLP